jgi:hypothetical protein
MPEHDHKFSYSVGDRVMVKEIQRPARVEILQVDTNGTMYRVTYWDNSKRESAWLYDDELEAR